MKSSWGSLELVVFLQTFITYVTQSVLVRNGVCAEFKWILFLEMDKKNSLGKDWMTMMN